jgi:lipopolysaccharide transport system ATP-binding protein
MNQSAITVDNVWKRYRKGQTGYHTLREDLYNLTGRLLDFGGEKRRDRDAEHIWALRDISFEIKPGERVGIIGRNGSGKTTLLRMLAGITRPNKGKIMVRGRLGVLIEIMAGFHPELTGRENVYLNGAIMGMSRKEIKRKFDEIVAFSELAEFIDTPIKRYSSGMHVRLGFAVAAHLDPDILLVDEVLAVGDAAFQQKCLGKMDTAAQEGRTVLFVSHNMEAVRRLCNRTMLLANGCIAHDGITDEVIEAYLSPSRGEDSCSREYSEAASPGDDNVRLRQVRVLADGRRISPIIAADESICIEIDFVVLRTTRDFHLTIRVHTRDGLPAFMSADWDLPVRDYVSEGTSGEYSLPPGSYVAHCTLPPNLLNSGPYSLSVVGLIPNVRYVFIEENAVTWEVEDLGGAGAFMSGRRPGVVRPLLEWRISRKE